MNKIIIVLILNLSTNLLFGQGFVKMDTIETPKKLTELISGRIIRTLQVDFTGDGVDDYICQLDFQDKTKSVYKEIWINSQFKIIKTKEKYQMDYDFFWLINIDNDPEPEIISATGYSDGIDYYFIDQNLKTGKDKVLFYFNPVITNGKNIFWGYPWDITGLIIKKDNGLLKIKCSVEHEITRDGEINKPDWQKKIPVIYFSGRSTQPDINVGKIYEFEWLTITKIIDKITFKNK